MDVLVAGAGIGGLAAAIALAGTGHRVVVAERRSELREIGAALSIWPNALAALEHLGIGEQVRAVGVEAPTASIRAASGRPIARFDTGAMRQALGGLPIVVLRAGLQTVLLEECTRLGVEIRLSHVVEGVSPDGSRLTAELPGCERSFDAVVGADGINSKVRAAVTDPGARRDCDRIAWRAVVPNGDGLVSDAWLTVGVGRQLIALRRRTDFSTGRPTHRDGTWSRPATAIPETSSSNASATGIRPSDN